jgi:fructoselysine-6-P-deglycase FrlB-like protein
MSDLNAAADASTTIMFREAAEAAEAVARQERAGDALKRIGAALRDRSPPVVITCARGSSDHAATYAKYAIETRVGVPVASAAPSVASVYASLLRPRAPSASRSRNRAAARTCLRRSRA